VPVSVAPEPHALAAEMIASEMIATEVIGSDTEAKQVPAMAQDEPAVGPSRLLHARYAGSNGTFACSRVGAP
jgi:hypothetical protein